MYLKIALLLSVFMQVATAVIAIGLIRKTRFNISWILISAAMLMMAVRLMYELPQVVDGVIVESTYALAISWMGVAISLSLLVGMSFINKIFIKLRDADNLRHEMDKKVLEAIIKAEETERKRIAKELHDGSASSFQPQDVHIDADSRSRKQPGRDDPRHETGGQRIHHGHP